MIRCIELKNKIDYYINSLKSDLNLETDFYLILIPQIFFEHIK